MKQPIKGGDKIKRKTKSKVKIIHKEEYGISKLEIKFAHEFLDKFGYKYIYQYEAKDIGRYFDFVLTAYDEINYLTENKHGLNSIKQEGQQFLPCLIIEVDGDYWHSNPNKYDINKLTPTQKRNKFVDKLKNEWAVKHSIPILRFWEEDIHNNPDYIINQIKKYMGEGLKKRKIRENKNRPH